MACLVDLLESSRLRAVLVLVLSLGWIPYAAAQDGSGPLPSIAPRHEHRMHAWDLRFAPGDSPLLAIGGIQGSKHATVAPLGGSARFELPPAHHSDGTNHVSWSSDGRWVAFSQKEGGVRIIDVATGRTAPLPEEIVGAHAMRATFSPTEAVIATFHRDSFGSDRGITVWSTETHERLAHLDRASGNFRWTPDGSQIVIASRDEVELWKWRDDTDPTLLASHGSCYGPLAIQSDAGRLAWGAGKTVFVLDLDTHTVTHTWPLEIQPQALAFLPGDRLVIGGCAKFSMSREAQVWSLATGRPILDLPMPSGWIFTADVSRDGAWLAIGGEAGVRVWSVEDLVATPEPSPESAGEAGADSDASGGGGR